MVCSNCYTGCTTITSDKCVKYTGLSNDILGIQNGDSLSYVQASIMGFLTSTLDGSGIKYELAPEDICPITSTWLTECSDITIVEITRALSKSICTLDTRLIDVETMNNEFNSIYVPNCISIVGNEGTHVVLQATLDRVCVNVAAIAAINLDLITNYVNIADINTYIENYLNSQSGGGGSGAVTGHFTKMVPFMAVEYYGNLSFFDATGAGTGDWVNIYLCNGNNNTPDKRGRVAVGTTSGMGGGTFASNVDPSISGNPTYTLRSTGGTNTVILTETQMPSHTHLAGATSTSLPHTHQSRPMWTNSTNNGGNGQQPHNYFDFTDSKPATVIVNTTVTVFSKGGGQAHSNVQPVIACHYIIYIPA